MRIIRDRRIVEDTFVHLDEHAPVPSGVGVVLPWSRWLAERASLADRGAPVGVRVAATIDLATLVEALSSLAVVAIEIPKFTDGRAYSLARRLRGEAGFSGELRAVGDVLRDQLLFLSRCGFDAFELAPGRSLEDALEAFGDHERHYQSSADRTRPLWTRPSPG